MYLKPKETIIDKSLFFDFICMRLLFSFQFNLSKQPLLHRRSMFLIFGQLICCVILLQVIFSITVMTFRQTEQGSLFYEC